MRKRLPAIDWMRGIVMILMATDHASGAYNSGRLVTDSALMYAAGMPLPPLQFFHRWLSHLCAPTFLFLAGTALALSIEKKVGRGESAGSIDRDMFVRGLIILAVDLFFINLFWLPGAILLQVMYAIGVAMILMIPLRRLPSPALLVIGVAILFAAEWFLPDGFVVSNEPGSVLGALTLGAGMFDTNLEAFGPWAALGIPDAFVAGYPVLPWLAMMVFGWVFGRWLLARREADDSEVQSTRLLAWTGLGALGVYAVIRGFNTFGNQQLYRLDGSWIQWLHVSKYPPSVAFTALELGLMCLILAGLFVLQRRQGENVNLDNPVLVFGQTAFFFYVVHIFFYEVTARLLGLHIQEGLLVSTIAMTVGLVVLYPVCLWYRGFKAKHAGTVLRYM
ncbi:MAG TPA: heparan-alpha-glucosaminide N-acetyltransferase domain-containing protein [Gemmatimonadota bacterium]|nr:heparan-alpha-glucosaminide N-acetyltransferase domain-containing protein [Gemmatimonadota bacterium]